MELANGLMTVAGSELTNIILDGIRRTSHERYDAHIEELPTLGPISRICLVVLLKVDKLKGAVSIAANEGRVQCANEVAKQVPRVPRHGHLPVEASVHLPDSP